MDMGMGMALTKEATLTKDQVRYSWNFDVVNEWMRLWENCYKVVVVCVCKKCPLVGFRVFLKKHSMASRRVLSSKLSTTPRVSLCLIISLSLRALWENCEIYAYQPLLFQVNSNYSWQPPDGRNDDQVDFSVSALGICKVICVNRLKNIWVVKSGMVLEVLGMADCNRSNGAAADEEQCVIGSIRFPTSCADPLWRSSGGAGVQSCGRLLGFTWLNPTTTTFEKVPRT